MLRHKKINALVGLLYFSLSTSTAVVSNLLAIILYYNVGGAEINESTKHVISVKQMFQHFHKSVFTFFSIHKILVLWYNCKSFLELLGSILLAHVFWELWVITCIQINNIWLIFLLVWIVIWLWSLRWSRWVISVFRRSRGLAGKFRFNLINWNATWAWFISQISLQMLDISPVLVIKEFIILILVYKLLRWLILININLFHLLSELIIFLFLLFCCLFLFFFLFLLLLFMSFLSLLKLLKHIFVMH